MRNDLLWHHTIGMQTRTCQQVASTSGGGCLAGLTRLAKSKIQTSLGTVGLKKICGSLSRGARPVRLGRRRLIVQRWIAAILGLFNAGNGLVMLFASSAWWASVPGVPDIGPFNPHFVQDVGAAFLVSGLSLAARAWRPVYWPAAVAGSAFL